MRTLNISKDNKEAKAPTPIRPAFQDDDERHPCWYADLESGDKRKDYKWKVGCKHQGQTDEYSFKVSKAGDINDDKTWNKLIGVDFAVELINKFKTGGTNEVKKWIKNGCP